MHYELNTTPGGPTLYIREVRPDDGVPFGQQEEWRAVWFGNGFPPFDPRSWRKVRGTWKIGAVAFQEGGFVLLNAIDKTIASRPIGDLEIK